MTSTFMGVELGKRALYAQQAALNTTGHNIANANTEGYTRQRADMQATQAIPYPGMSNDATPGQIGTGVEVTQMERLREGYLDVQYRGQNKDLGYYQAQADTYSKVEGLLNEPSDTGIANAMDQFWQSWEDLSKSPDSSSARAVVRQSGVALTESFQYVDDSLNQMKSDLNNQINVTVSDVNSVAQQIGALNDQISRLVPNNYQPNDLYDKRDVLLDQLSKLVNVDVKTSTNGMVDVYAGGQILVQGKTANTVSVQQDPAKNQVTLSIAQSPPAAGTNTLTLQSGQLLGEIDSATKIIPGIQNNINQLETAFINQINTVHENGDPSSSNPQALNLDDISNPQNTPTVTTTEKRPFFTQDTKGNWVVNPDIMTSLNKIAAASQASVGDGTNAQAIADIKNTVLTINNSSATADDYYQNIIGQLGVDSQQAQRMQDNTQSLVNQVDNQRQSVSGVSLDEEMTNMVKFQQAYNAAARVVTVMDQVLDKVINGMGAGL